MKLNMNFLFFLMVHLVGGVKKWEDRKWRDDRKVEGQKKFSSLSYVFGWEGRKVEGWKTFLFG